MLRMGIYNPHINSLLSRVRHQNILVIADRGFTNYLGVETVDISLIDDIPTVLQVFDAIKTNFDICQIYMAEGFRIENTIEVQNRYKKSYGKIPITFEPSDNMKKRAPKAIGIIRTGDSIQYANMLLVSGRVNG
ncbi:MAG: RbsD/FucU family protein [Desulfobacterales bacterium]|nr:RbsD/FucU family protein [Desulfobacterales bacterium]